MNRLTNDDLFEGTTMSFGEHLEELRACLFKSVIGLVLGVLVGFWVATPVVNFFQKPLNDALQQYYLTLAEDRLKKEQGGEITPEQRSTLKEARMVREVLNVDVDRLVDVIGQTYPQAVAGGAVRRNVFLPRDLSPKQEAALSEALLRQFGGTGENDLALNTEQKETLTRLKDKRDAFTSDDRTALVTVLNDLLDRPQLADDAALRSFPADAASVEQLKKEIAAAPDPEKTRRLNKLLLAGTFTKELHTPQLNLIELSVWKPVKVEWQVLNAEEAFMIWMKAGIVAGFMLASPWIFYQIWLFISAGLYPHEKNYVFLYLPISMILFFAGAWLAFKFVFGPVLTFLFQFQQDMGATFEPRIGEWLGFVLILPLGFGISFQLPLVMLLLNRLGLVSVTTYTANWRISILAIFVIAMVLTPADPVSMLLMAIPLCFLYVLGIGLCLWMPRSRNPFGEVYEP